MNQQTRQRLGITPALWVKASDVKRITGWSRYDMEKARELNWVRWERRKKADGTTSFFYDANTIPEKLIRIPIN